MEKFIIKDLSSGNRRRSWISFLIVLAIFGSFLTISVIRESDGSFAKANNNSSSAPVQTKGFETVEEENAQGRALVNGTVDLMSPSESRDDYNKRMKEEEAQKLGEFRAQQEEQQIERQRETDRDNGEVRF